MTMNLHTQTTAPVAAQATSVSPAGAVRLLKNERV